MHKRKINVLAIELRELVKPSQALLEKVASNCHFDQCDDLEHEEDTFIFDENDIQCDQPSSDDSSDGEYPCYFNDVSESTKKQHDTFVRNHLYSKWYKLKESKQQVEFDLSFPINNLHIHKLIEMFMIFEKLGLCKDVNIELINCIFIVQMIHTCTGCGGMQYLPLYGIMCFNCYVEVVRESSDIDSQICSYCGCIECADEKCGEMWMNDF